MGSREGLVVRRKEVEGLDKKDREEDRRYNTVEEEMDKMYQQGRVRTPGSDTLSMMDPGVHPEDSDSRCRMFKALYLNGSRGKI